MLAVSPLLVATAHKQYVSRSYLQTNRHGVNYQYQCFREESV